MGFWDFLRRGDSVPIAAMTPNVTYVNGPGELAEVFDIRGLSVSKLWRTQPHLRTVVSFRARNVAHLGVHSFRRQGEDRLRDRDSVFAQLMRRPNSSQTSYELMFALVGDLDLYDRAYWLVARDVDQPSGWSLRRLPPPWVSVSKSNAFEVTEYNVTSGGEKSIKVPADQILSFSGYHPTNPLLGSSTIEALREILAEQVEASKYRAQVWKRGGRVSAVLQRPSDAPEWSAEAREAFREDWYAKYTGQGTHAGGTPLLEDGMTLNRIDFTAQEQQFVEASKLALSTVASAFHINPTMVGVLDNANYSNVREFRRMLYGDSLGPLIAQIESRINAFLLPKLEMDDSVYYAEFNLAEKLQGSFEEQAMVMQTMVGAPLMTRNEGRAKFNLPGIDGGDELITPLNVLVGGQASPTDSAPDLASSVDPGTKAIEAALKSAPSESQQKQVAQVLSKFFDRQSKTVLSAIGAGGMWWDEARWDRELAKDLLKVSYSLTEVLGRAEAKRLGYPEHFDPEIAIKFLAAVSVRYAKTINDTTKGQIVDSLRDPDADPAHVFDVAKDSRADGVGSQVAVFVGGFSTIEAAKQIGRIENLSPTKTWITGPNPRPEHARMNGETVPIDEPFSNGMDWPGSGGGPDDVGCNCAVQVDVP